ncbi:aspartate dehydrogenase [Chromohalobacter israelensis]|uniref:aspartate dehydrogenase n=1 Tax=Chromohalobacter israelensis TaxID=141390 RepID=UPI000FFF194D|nr:aspartate dehydrogenase [Chromohalobacter salexigens]RXE46698.1 aspartate dehydrogenase [Chromohalobacter salexigens]
MTAKTVMMIGYGAMGRAVHELLPSGMTLRWVVVPESSVAETVARLGQDVEVMTSVDTCRERPDLVVECAGQAGLAEHGGAVLARGWSLAVVSVGALADDALYGRLHDAARRSGGKLHVLAGAVAGMDGLAAAREGGLESVTYEARKAPASWRGSHAEELVDLDAVAQPTVFFEGSAGDAARRFPANANVAATVALAGLGMENTTVRLTVDPDTTRNTHRIHARGHFGEFEIELSGYPLASNPKTSTLAALSVVRACRQVLEPVVV